jgi:Holliday junction resolvase
MAYISSANGGVRSADVVALSESRVITIEIKPAQLYTIYYTHNLG